MRKLSLERLNNLHKVIASNWVQSPHILLLLNIIIKRVLLYQWKKLIGINEAANGKQLLRILPPL